MFKGFRKFVAYANKGFKYGFEATKGKVFNYENYLKLWFFGLQNTLLNDGAQLLRKNDPHWKYIFKLL